MNVDVKKIFLLIWFVTFLTCAASDDRLLEVANSFRANADLLEKQPVEIIYSVQIAQYPNYQEVVFKNNEAVIEKLKSSSSQEQINIEYIKGVFDGSRFSCHRLREHGKLGSVTLNTRITRDDTSTRSLLYKPGSKLSESITNGKDSGELKLDSDIANTESNLKAPDLPWNILRGFITADWNELSPDSKINLDENASNLKCFDDGETLIVKTESKLMTTMYCFSKQLLLPVEIVQSRLDRPTKSVSKITYIDVETALHEKVFIPERIEQSNEVLFNGNYHVYFSRNYAIHSLKFLTNNQAEELISKVQPVVFKQDEIPVIR